MEGWNGPRTDSKTRGRVMSDWRKKSLLEIQAVKPFWAAKYKWQPSTVEHEDYVDLFVHFSYPRSSRAEQGRRELALRLRYRSDYETAGRREAFVNPRNFAEEGIQFWPTGVRGINPSQTPPNVCLEGTWGFHSHLHKERNG